jgi:molybdenum cofactor biosynthesis protein B
VAVLTASDTRTAENDASGRWIRERLGAAGHEVVDYRISRDDADLIETAVREQIAAGAEVIVTAGGTGLSPRDQVPEVLERICSRTIPGFGEIFRHLSFEEIGPPAMASRAIAGVCEGALVFALPGSTAACRLGLEKLILPELSHLTAMVRGKSHGSPG